MNSDIRNILEGIQNGTVSVDDALLRLKQEPFAELGYAKVELNKVYQIDIYFYIEGCDPDCTSEKVGLDSAALQLGFYGLLAE